MREKGNKITVRHYLNKRAKGRTLSGEKYYPLYLLIIVSGQKAQIKSKISEYTGIYRSCLEEIYPEKAQLELIAQGYLTDNLLTEINTGKKYPLLYLMNDEILVITYIIRKLLSSGRRKVSLSHFSYLYDLHLKDINLVLDDHVKKYYITDLTTISSRFNKKEYSDKVYKVSDYFIHYINWHKSFCSYYKTTCEVLPTEISLVENHLNDELRKDIKALLALESRNNFLLKFLNKKELGKFPFPNYIDWVEKGKEFVTKEFIKSFGKQKAAEYVTAIDAILAMEIIQKF